MELKIVTNSEFMPDFMDVVRAFSPSVVIDENEEKNIIYIDIVNDAVTLKFKEKTIKNRCYLQNLSQVKQKSEIKRLAKIMLYDILSELTNITLPYGSLTGIRPTKLYHELQESGKDALLYFTDYLRVPEQSAKWIGNICDNQKGIYTHNPKQVDFFVNIPICVTRCSYCSFISAELGRIKKWIEPYVAQVVREIKHAISLVENLGVQVRSIYVGGGTPTSLSEKDFEKIIVELGKIKCNEFTVEAGRPDTITREKLQIMADNGVTRISINPQTFNDKTLAAIGRNHTKEDIFNVYNMAREFDFDINMDLIAMLPDESFEDFKYSVDKAINLNPDNITVHTLAIKKGSNLKLAEYDNKIELLPEKMIEYSRNAIISAGYLPYYMYRQKYMSGNLDNTGYAKQGKACVYNIDIMEETHSIIACGAGAISKRIWGEENRLERLANPKGIDVYLEREDIILKSKQEFFEDLVWLRVLGRFWILIVTLIENKWAVYCLILQKIK